MKDYDQIFKILNDIEMLSEGYRNPSIEYNVKQLKELLDKFVLWKKENIKFQSSFEPGPGVCIYTLKTWFNVEYNMNINSAIIDNNFRENALPELKNDLIKYIDYNLRYGEEER